MRMSPREFAILMTAEVERTYDLLEREAMVAIMHANANNSRKRVKASNLFKRPTQAKKSKRTVEDLKREEEEVMDWLGQFEHFREKV